ncbi:MAG: 4Fe-4S dicluster domain-containing protein [Pseudomonadales bacterium]
MKQAQLRPLANWADADAQTLLKQIADAGVVGLGGGGFPTAEKLRSALAWHQSHAAQEVLLIGNGVACEPGIDADPFILAEAALEVLLGLRIAAHILNVREPVLALGPRLQHRQAELEKLWQSLNEDLPQTLALRIHCSAGTAAAGAERLLIEAVGGQAVAAEQPPAAQGVVVQNVVTLWAIARAICDGEALGRRPVTVGQQTRWLEFGAPLPTPQATAGAHIVNGGLWSGTTAQSATCVDAQTLAVHAKPGIAAVPCIGCGYCLPVCPVHLDPEHLHRCLQALANEQPSLVEAQDAQGPLAALRSAALTDCVECGACNVSCPSHIDLLGEFRAGKSTLARAESVVRTAQRASERFARHQRRLAERDAQATERRAQRLKRTRSWGNESSTQ